MLSQQQEVTASDLEQQLALLNSRTSDPRAGVFGPGTKLWEVNREAVIFLGGGRAALLQLAHPAVAEGIHQHSRTRDDPFGRFRRTFWNVFRMVYGDLDEATQAARAVHRVHDRITGIYERDVGRHNRGESYRANEASALFWVHATLWDTSVRMFELLVRPLTSDEKDCYYRESLRFAQLFGLEPALLPQSWAEFEAYNQAMWTSEELAVSPCAAEMASFLFRPHNLPFALSGRWLRTMTISLLPDPVRDKFGLELRPSARRLFQISIALMAKGLRFTPRRIRYLPPYLGALRRIEGRERRDRVGDWLSSLYVGRAQPASARSRRAP